MLNSVPRDWFAGSTTVVTGAASGLGRATAEAFAVAGARVALIDRSVEEGEAAAAALSRDGFECKFYRADVVSSGTLEKVLESVSQEFGPIHTVVANAGTYPNTDFLEISETEWDMVVGTNLKGAFLTCQHAGPRMRRGGSIVTFSSGVAVSAIRGWAHYSAAKAGIVALTRAMALELAPLGIRVNCVMPGYIEIGAGGAHLDEDYRRSMMTRNLVGRPGRPTDIAASVLMLASPLSEFITGAVLRVDGGASAGRIEAHPSGPREDGA